MAEIETGSEQGLLVAGSEEDTALARELRDHYARAEASAKNIVALSAQLQAAAQLHAVQAQFLRPLADLQAARYSTATTSPSTKQGQAQGASTPPRASAGHSASSTSSPSSSPQLALRSPAQATAHAVLSRLGSPATSRYAGAAIEHAAAQLDAVHNKPEDAQIFIPAGAAAAEPADAAVEAAPELDLQLFAPPFNSGQPGAELVKVWRAVWSAHHSCTDVQPSSSSPPFDVHTVPGMSAGKVKVLLRVLESRGRVCQHEDGSWRYSWH